MQVNLVSSHNCPFFVDSWIHVFRWKGTKCIRPHWYWKASDVINNVYCDQGEFWSLFVIVLYTFQKTEDLKINEDRLEFLYAEFDLSISYSSNETQLSKILFFKKKHSQWRRDWFWFIWRNTDSSRAVCYDQLAPEVRAAMMTSLSLKRSLSSSLSFSAYLSWTIFDVLKYFLCAYLFLTLTGPACLQMAQRATLITQVEQTRWPWETIENKTSQK